MLIGLEVVTGHHWHISPELLQDGLVVFVTQALQKRNLLTVLLPLNLIIVAFLLVVRFVLGQEVSVLGKETEDGDRWSDLRLIDIVLLQLLTPLR